MCRGGYNAANVSKIREIADFSHKTKCVLLVIQKKYNIFLCRHPVEILKMGLENILSVLPYVIISFYTNMQFKILYPLITTYFLLF